MGVDLFVRLHSEAFRIVYRGVGDEFGLEVGWAIAALAIALAGIVVAYIFLVIGACCTGARSSKRLKRIANTDKYKEVTHKSREAWTRLITTVLAILAAVLGFWISTNVLGVNFWTLVLGYGILSIIITYGFGGDTLRAAGAFLIISLTDKIETELWFEIPALGVQGMITAIHVLWVEMAYVDANKNVVEVHVPTYQFLAQVTKRLFYKEIEQHDMIFEARLDMVSLDAKDHEELSGTGAGWSVDRAPGRTAGRGRGRARAAGRGDSSTLRARVV